jgi:hypothetical protein
MIKKMVFQAPPSWRLEEVVVLAKLRAANIIVRARRESLTPRASLRSHSIRACNEYCVNGYTSRRRAYGHFQGNTG